MGHFIGLSVYMRKRTKIKMRSGDPDSHNEIPQVIIWARTKLVDPFHHDGAITLELNSSEAAIHR
jgi:hypothetical protein